MLVRLVVRIGLSFVAAATFVLTARAAQAARDPAPGFAELSLELPGMPAALIPADMDRDGRQDLVVLVAYTTWGQTAETERVSFDGIEGLVEVMSVVGAWVDRRELRVYLARDGGVGYRELPVVLDLDASVHALQAGGRSEALLAITDQGVSAVRLDGTGDAAALNLVPLLATETVLAGTGAFYADLRFLDDLDGDGAPDLLLPTTEGWSVFAGTASGFESEPRSRVPKETAERSGPDDRDPPTDGGVADQEGEGDGDSDSERHRRRPPPIPEVVDLDGDGRRDLLVFQPGEEPLIARQADGLSFDSPVALRLGDGEEEIVFVGPLDAAGEIAVVSQREIEPPEDAGWRVEVDHAKRPLHEYRRYVLTRDLEVGPLRGAPFRAVGYTFAGSDRGDEETDVRLPGGFQDLDGDGRLDLVSISLEFSVLPMVMRVMVLRRIALTMDFHPWCQEDDGRFRQVPGLDLSGRFKINLRNAQIQHLSQFAGDFDGDGRADFVQLGRGRKATIHQGGPGCTYPTRASRTIRFWKEPRHLGLVRILDLDGDRRSDLYVVHPRKAPKAGGSAPVRVDLYLSQSESD